jgi:phosphatidylinositol alpha-1,6-mannosyltransferase
MERLNLHMAIELAKDFDVTVIGPAGCRSLLPGNIEVIQVPAKPLWRFFLATLMSSIRVARRFRPDIVLGGSGLVAPFAGIAARLSAARLAIYVHGLDLVAEHPVYRWFWPPFIRRADLCICNSENTARLAAEAGIAQSRIVVVHPGVDLPAPEAQPPDFRIRFGVGDRPMLLSVGRLIPRKGLLEFVENTLPRVVARFPDVCLVVLGDDAPDLLQSTASDLGKLIRACAADLGLTGNVLFIGPQDDATLAAAYRSADVHVFPVREVTGDVEGFGMVAVEAAAYGLPTVAFAVGGVPDAVADGVSGRLLAPGDYAGLAAAILDLLDRRPEFDLSDGAARFAALFNWDEFGNKIRRHLHNVVLREA